jgi:hypothetical protein
MGIFDFFENRLRKKMKKIATKSARIMLWTAKMNQHSRLEPYEFARLAIQGRSDYYLDHNNYLICFGRNTGFQISEGVNIADVIEFVVMYEFKDDSVLLNYPVDHQEYINYAGSVAREYVSRKVVL